MIPRVFRLYRLVDETGISGTGLIADGVLFSDGTCALRWLTKVRSTGTYATLADLVAIHGHGGKTKVVFQALTPEEQRQGTRSTSAVLGSGCFELPCCLHCHHPIIDHWGDNCGACMSGRCDCTLMNHPERVPAEAMEQRA